MTEILIVIVIVLVFWVVSLKSRLKESSESNDPCERCGTIGTAKHFIGLGDEYAKYFKEPLKLCFDCCEAQKSFLDNRIMLETEGSYHFGRSELIEAAKLQWGDQALDMLALLFVARDDMDAARRVLSPESFEEVRPWLEAAVEKL